MFTLLIGLICQKSKANQSEETYKLLESIGHIKQAQEQQYCKSYFYNNLIIYLIHLNPTFERSLLSGIIPSILSLIFLFIEFGKRNRWFVSIYKWFVSIYNL